MGYSSRCSICTHPEAERINDMLRRKAQGDTSVTHRTIIKVINELGSGPELNEWGISRHASKHFDVHAEARRRAAEQYEDASEECKERVMTDLEFLDAIRDEAVKMLSSGDLKPDLKDAIAAVKTKHGQVLKNDDPVQVLIDMVADVARK